MKKVFLLLVLSTLLISDDISELARQYREQGIAPIVKAFNGVFAKKSYWEQTLEDKASLFGYFDKESIILSAVKDKKEMRAYVAIGQNAVSIAHYSIMTGKYEGDKQKEGDRKTPLGVYTITETKNPPPSPFYGPLAFVTSYPNMYDVSRGKNGHGIWIHGVPMNGENRDDDTKGCIALENNKLLDLAQKIDPTKTLILISEKGFSPIPKATLVTLLSDLYRWRGAWEEGDIETYLSFYDETFKRFDGMEKERFSQYKRNVFAKKERREIMFTGVSIIVSPTSLVNETIFRIAFFENYNSPSHKFAGEKELYVKVSSQMMKIIAEK